MKDKFLIKASIMTTSKNNLSKTKASAVKTIRAAIEILLENDGELPLKGILNEIPNRVDFNEWESGKYVKTGYIRWVAVLQFYSIDLTKAGFSMKKQFPCSKICFAKRRWSTMRKTKSQCAWKTGNLEPGT